MIPEEIAAQTDATVNNMERALSAAGLGDVVKVTAHLQHLHERLAPFNEVYARRSLDCDVGFEGTRCPIHDVRAVMVWPG